VYRPRAVSGVAQPARFTMMPPGSRRRRDDSGELVIRGHVTLVERAGGDLRELQGDADEIVGARGRLLVPGREVGGLVHGAEHAAVARTARSRTGCRASSWIASWAPPWGGRRDRATSWSRRRPAWRSPSTSTDPVSQVVSQSQPKSAKLAAEAVVAGGRVWTSRDVPRDVGTAEERPLAPRIARICFARSNTASSISSVSLPVKVFCWLTTSSRSKTAVGADPRRT
jgi:hypothetical protein